LWYQFCRFWAQIVFILSFKLRVFGRENVPLEGPVILVSNHQSFLDPILVGVGLARPIHFLARSTLFESSRLFGALIRSLNAIPLKRSGFSKEALRQCIDLISAGGALALFPEGTRTHNGNIGPLKSGFSVIARRAKATVVPVLVDGAFKAWPRSKLLPGLIPITVRFGKPFTHDQMGKNISEQVREALINLRMEVIRK